MIDKLDQIISKLEFVRDCVDEEGVVDDLTEIIDDLCEWENENFPEKTDDD